MDVSSAFLRRIFALLFALLFTILLAIAIMTKFNNSELQNVQPLCPLDSIAQDQLDVLVNCTNAVTEIFRVQNQKASLPFANFQSLLLAVKEQLNLMNSQCSQTTVQSIAVEVGNMADAIQFEISQTSKHLFTIWKIILTKIVSFHAEVRNAKLKVYTVYASIPQEVLDILATRMDTITTILQVQDRATTPPSPDFFDCVIQFEAQLGYVNSQLPAQNLIPVYKLVKKMRREAYSGKNLTIQYFIGIWNPILEKMSSFQTELHNAKQEVLIAALASIPQGSLDILATRIDAVTAMLHVQDKNTTQNAPELSNHLTQLQSQLISVNSKCAAANLLTIAQKVGEMTTEAQSGRSLTIQYFHDMWSPLLAEIVTFQTNVANAKVKESKHPTFTPPPDLLEVVD